MSKNNLVLEYKIWPLSFWERMKVLFGAVVGVRIYTDIVVTGTDAGGKIQIETPLRAYFRVGEGLARLLWIVRVIDSENTEYAPSDLPVFTPGFKDARVYVASENDFAAASRSSERLVEVPYEVVADGAPEDESNADLPLRHRGVAGRVLGLPGPKRHDRGNPPCLHACLCQSPRA